MSIPHGMSSQHNIYFISKVKPVSVRKSGYSIEEKNAFVIFYYSTVDPEKHMICEPCDSKLLGGFDHDKKEV